MAADIFTFTTGNKNYTIPAFSSLPAGALRQARKTSDDIDKAFTILEYVTGDNSPEIKAIDTMPVSEFGEFIKAWTGSANSAPIPKP